MQTDPLGYVDGLNLYTYVGNNPASWVDPLGLWFGFDDVITGPVDELLVLGYVFCRATGGCELPPIRDMLPDWTDYSPPPYPAYRVPGPDPMIFVPADEAARQNISGSPSPEFCPTPDPGPLVNPIPGDDPVFDPRIIDPFPGNDPVFDPVMASESGDDTIVLYHGSIDNASTIKSKGLDMRKDPTYTSTDSRAAQNAIDYRRQNFPHEATDPDIIKSAIPKSEFENLQKDVDYIERTYEGFYGAYLHSSEILLISDKAKALFNQYRVRYVSRVFVNMFCSKVLGTLEVPDTSNVQRKY